MRKLIGLLALLSVFGASAVVAPAAFAGEASAVLPGKLATEWTGVKVEPAPAAFTAVSKKSVLFIGTTAVATCEVKLVGSINATGGDEVNIAASSVTGTGLCPSIGLQSTEASDWKSQICEWKAGTPHQYWDQLRVNFSTPLGAAHGFIYIHLLNAAKADPAAPPLVVAFGSVGKGTTPAFIDSSEFGILANDLGGSEMYKFTPATTKVTSTETSCPWNFANLNG